LTNSIQTAAKGYQGVTLSHTSLLGEESIGSLTLADSATFLKLSIPHKKELPLDSGTVSFLLVGLKTQ
jgi:hypothetical protein